MTLRLFGIGTDGVLEAGHLIETSLGSQGIVDSGQQHARRGEGDEQNVPMDDVQSTPAVQETSEQNESRPHGQDEGLDIVQDADDTAASLKSRSIIVEDEAPQDMPMLSDRDVDGSNPDIPLQPPTLDEDSLAAVEPQSGAGIVDLKRDRNEADNDERDDRPAIRRRLSEDLTDIPSTPFSLELTYPELPDIETPVPSSPPPRTPTAQPEAHKTPVHSPGRTATTAKLMSPSTPPTAADTGSVPRTPVPAPASPAMQVHVTPEPLSLSAVAGTSSASKTPVPVPVSPADKSRRTPVISEPAGPTAAVRGTPSPAQTSVSASSPLEIRAVKEEPLDGGLPSSSKVAASRRPLLGISHLALAYHIGKRFVGARGQRFL
ncbi:hypothetical protein OE88DRAFT_1239215 [Heliocybe sulcata]|uniref:Uncharacterized protein n=1 Tax=Heliocybe sulcata TaxID=5364 RepID=A0A5C3N660_9AGAM|nr:hypothetical protein OE88DRAFT_1239215 [Heliocybe sulcata]